MWITSNNSNKSTEMSVPQILLSEISKLVCILEFSNTVLHFIYFWYDRILRGYSLP
jgi:hypothetical protein